MSQMEPRQLYQVIEKSHKEQSFSPIYFFFGDEPYLIQQALQYLKVCALHGGAADFNFSSYYAADTETSRIRDEVETLPMMAPRRVVIVKEVQDFSDKEWEQLEPILQNPVDSTVLILIGSRIDKRKKYFKLLYEQSLFTEFKKPFENQIPGWVRQICKAHELEISDEAVQLLHRLVGNQLIEIEAEVRKLADFIGERKNIELEDVAQCVSKRREQNVFGLAARIAAGDRVEALLQLADLLDDGQSEVGIVTLVARHIRILLTLKQGMETGISGQKLATYSQVPNYYLQEYVSQCQLWSVKKLESALLVLAETDRALKSSPLSSHIWLENLVIKTCALTGSPSHSQRSL
jgi:DNA polymerase-3 subunit delta